MTDASIDLEELSRVSLIAKRDLPNYVEPGEDVAGRGWCR
jgi:hypothetical protein